MELPDIAGDLGEDRCLLDRQDVGREGELDLDVAPLRGDDTHQGVWATSRGAAGLLGLGPEEERAHRGHEKNDDSGGDAVASEESHRFSEAGEDKVIGLLAGTHSMDGGQRVKPAILLC